MGEYTLKMDRALAERSRACHCAHQAPAGDSPGDLLTMQIPWPCLEAGGDGNL